MHCLKIEYIDELALWSAPFGLKLLDRIHYKPKLSVLDIGFGTGFPLTEIAMRLGDSCTIYGIDPWTEAIKRVERKLDCYSISNTKLIEGVAESIPLDDCSIDLITSNNGINNVSDIERVMAECSRIMKPNGQFVFTFNMDKSMFEFYSELEAVFDEMGLTDNIELMDKHISAKRPSVDYFQKILNANGFVIKDMEQDQFNYYFATGTAMLKHYFIRLAFMDSWSELMPKDKIGYIYDCIEKRLNKKAQLLGGIRLSIPFLLTNAVKV